MYQWWHQILSLKQWWWQWRRTADHKQPVPQKEVPVFDIVTIIKVVSKVRNDYSCKHFIS